VSNALLSRSTWSTTGLPDLMSLKRPRIASTESTEMAFLLWITSPESKPVSGLNKGRTETEAGLLPSLSRHR
jgi:hypothetical protein